MNVYLENHETLPIFCREFEELLPHDEDGVRIAVVKSSFSIAEFIQRAAAFGFVRPEVDADIVAGLLLDRLLNQARFVHAHKEYFGVSTLDPEYRPHWIRATLAIVFDGINAPVEPAS